MDYLRYVLGTRLCLCLRTIVLLYVGGGTWHHTRPCNLEHVYVMT